MSGSRPWPWACWTWTTASAVKFARLKHEVTLPLRDGAGVTTRMSRREVCPAPPVVGVRAMGDPLNVLLCWESIETNSWNPCWPTSYATRD
jgi:hypothetical protein